MAQANHTAGKKYNKQFPPLAPQKPSIQAVMELVLDERRLSMCHTTKPLDEGLRAYLLSIEPPENEQLRRLRELTATLPLARFQIAPEQGYLLAFLVHLAGAQRALEIGTFTGYSALAVALALPSGGRLVACEIDEQWIEVGRPFWQRAGVEAKIEVKMIGPALATLSSLEETGAADSFDLAFIDANKED